MKIDTPDAGMTHLTDPDIQKLDYNPATDFSPPTTLLYNPDNKASVSEDALADIIDGDAEPATGLLGGLPADAPRSLAVAYSNEPTGGALGNRDGEPDIQKIKEIVADTIDVVLPDALVLGASGPRGGTFGLESFATGEITSFNSLSLNGPGQSVVGTVALDQEGNIKSEAGFGYAKKIEIPVLANTEALVFVNARSDSLPNDLEWKPDGSSGLIPDVKEGETVTVSVNVGGAYSVSDAAAATVYGAVGSALVPGSGGFATRLGAETANATKYDAWAGLAWRATATFDSEGLVSVKIGDTEIPAEEIGDFIGNVLGKSAGKIDDQLGGK
ncbi:hypothetical protein [Roseobacter weihaiensis]|uniref:hypothetical protein n=1 Tax=Roseobacter weihaiensis TaxID=2763262 RepID=UPI001D0BB143|nr:hypothetical protein [Roseobacter sp. H9]